MTKYFGFTIIGLFILSAVFGHWIAPYSQNFLDINNEFSPPSIKHLLGTGENGLDLLSGILHGSRLSFTIALSVILFSTVLGTVLGTVAGWRRGIYEIIIMRSVDLLLAFPSLLLNIAFVALIAKPMVIHLILALTINGWVGYARLSYAQTINLKNREFILAAISQGMSEIRIIFKHIIPNIIGPIIVQATFGFGAVVFTESTLSFLGLGPQGSISWGNLLDQGVSYLMVTPRVALVAGVPIALVILGSNLLGDYLRDKLG